jgi:phage tail tube protein FII
VDKKKGNGQRVYVGKLPSITLKTQELKEGGMSRPNFRNRKLSSSIRDMEGNFFSTEFG